ncbi:MAG: DUF3822 family protein [Flavobacteriaceae bacterium]|nr:DUF3822 family protein [Flavobacteriaceae bacterium]
MEQKFYKTLSIQVSLGGLSFCILDAETNTITQYKRIIFDKKLGPTNLLDKLKHLFNTETVLQQNFKTVQLVHKNELATLVPKSLFNEDCIADYLKFNTKILPTDFITYDAIATEDMVNVYVPYVNINNYIYDTFGAFEFKHFSSILLENILSQQAHYQSNRMYIHVETSHFEIIVTKGHKFLYYNSFEYSTKTDFIYYVLFVAEQLELNPEVFEAILLGFITAEDELYDILYTYVRHVSFYKFASKHRIATNIKTLNKDFTLLNSF